MGALLSLRNGTFSYGDKRIFSDITLDVLPGEILCILGANGCGKTTLLRCLNGSLRLARGHVFLDKLDLYNMSVVDVARRMGFVFQEHSAPFPFSVLEVVSMGRAPYLGFFESPSPKDVNIAEQSLEMVGMLHLKDKPYTKISGGERQLILIARTLTQTPDVILLDEPCSHLDFKNQALVLKIISKLSQKGLTVLMTTHLPNHALLLSGKVALMSGGKILAVGDVENVITEKRLEETYGIGCAILTADSPVTGTTIKFCVPIN